MMPQSVICLDVCKCLLSVSLLMQLQWFLSLGDFIVALEDASLIQMSTVVRGTNVSVQGRRTEVLSPVNVTL